MPRSILSTVLKMLNQEATINLLKNGERTVHKCIKARSLSKRTKNKANPNQERPIRRI